MRYSYFCSQCGMELVDGLYQPIGTPHPTRCEVCGGLMRRGISFSFRRSLPEHYNHAVGRYVSNDRQFTDALKSKSEEMSVRLGMDCNYQPVDIADMKANGVTDEGLETTYRTHHDRAISG